MGVVRRGGSDEGRGERGKKVPARLLNAVMRALVIAYFKTDS